MRACLVRGPAPGQLLYVLAVADVGEREPEPAGQAFSPLRGLEQPDGSAGVLQCPADEGEGRVHV
jgi:hypothetical protein